MPGLSPERCGILHVVSAGGAIITATIIPCLFPAPMSAELPLVVLEVRASRKGHNGTAAVASWRTDDWGLRSGLGEPPDWRRGVGAEK